MMMRMSNMLRVVPALTLAAALGNTPLQAASLDPTGTTVDETAATPSEVRVVNNHEGRVSVYAVDQEGTRLYLGSVNRTQFRAFTLPVGTTRLQVLPRSAPAGLGARDSQSAGIETRAIEFQAGQIVQLWLEPGLTRSTASILTA